MPATTLRFWDAHGLLTPDRLDNGHRRYRPAHLARVEMIRMCQTLGCTIEEVKLILDPPEPAARIAYAQRRLPDTMCSTRSTPISGPSTFRNRLSSVSQNPWQAVAAAQIGQWFSMKRKLNSFSRLTSAM